MTFEELQKKRRSIYALGKEVKKSPEELFNMIKEAVKESPSPFNSQSVKAVVLTGAAHEKLWEMTLVELKKVSASEEAFQATTAKVKGAFEAGFGTVLYFTDENIVQGLKEQAPLYASNFDSWAEEAIGIALYSVWMRLAEDNIGASIQHYNPLIDQAVKEAFDIPASWTLRGEMPFGSIEAPADPKTFVKDDERFKLFD
ncbi:Fatty acid repression mutant protein (predicted oxidoreductase) (FMR2) [Fructobacillus fructosus]|uniref:nitroreductase family protein n=1 Tax=Fructobacillus fructosus TaxID=1631 RepID=UPI0002194008|nr:nitroreductase family protein [Fructobacillus fructosus]KRN52473.1 hypothetical protein IV71_GL001297 [Fructobacillus fructosus KCTC 3544]GAP01680.1 nitroreductase family protein [Fructobacillus fructosus]CAK1240756.1 Fatty acid repression mutant protein (predicted oxidoreductase) (FMR2) [Fructobacillus fructosus]